MGATLLRFFSGILGGCLLSACSSAQPYMQFLPTEPWRESKTDAHRGTVLLVHGLNNRPQVMDPLATRLADEGFDSYLVTLRGHESNAPWPDVDFEAQWTEDFERALKSAQSRFPNQPIYGVGYSLGATIIAAYLAEHPEAHFSGLVLISPAWPLTLRSRLIRAFLPLDLFGMSLPSFAPEAYRAHNRTSLHAYRSLFRLADFMQELSDGEILTQMGGTPTLCAMSRDDRLVSFRRMDEWLKQRKLAAWQLEELHPEPNDPSLPAHLVLDEESMGHDEWERFVKLILEEFRLGRK